MKDWYLLVNMSNQLALLYADWLEERGEPSAEMVRELGGNLAGESGFGYRDGDGYRDGYRFGYGDGYGYGDSSGHGYSHGHGPSDSHGDGFGDGHGEGGMP